MLPLANRGASVLNFPIAEASEARLKSTLGGCAYEAHNGVGHGSVLAVNSGNQPPGPPFESGSPNTEGARAFHCETIGAKGASVTNKNGQPTRCR